MSPVVALVGKCDCEINRERHVMQPDFRRHQVDNSGGRFRGDMDTQVLYLGTVLGLGHRYQELEYGLGLGHQRGHGVDDGGELGEWFNP